MSNILLGSESPGRKHVLEKFGFSFDSFAPKVDEKSISGSLTFQEAVDLVLFNSQLKMGTLLEKASNINNFKLLITSDTTVFCNNKIYEKTYDKKLAITLLQELAGKTHQVITGVTLRLLDEVSGTLSIEKNFFDVTEVTITDKKDLIEYYLNSSDDCLGKAGCYGIQSAGSLIIEDLKGNLDNVIGLPIVKIIETLDRKFLNLLKNSI